MRNTLAALLNDYSGMHMPKLWRSFFIDIYSSDWNVHTMNCTTLHTFAQQINHFSKIQVW